MVARHAARAAWLIAFSASACLVHGCRVPGGDSSRPWATEGPGNAPAGTARPEEQPPRPATRQFHLGPAATSLVTQAHRQAGEGDYGQAAATLERALRIEPDNPLLWIELGRIRMGENNPAQADALARKALALGTGDPAAQSGAWRLMADSLRARNRNGEAAEAEQRAQALAPR